MASRHVDSVDFFQDQGVLRQGLPQILCRRMATGKFVCNVIPQGFCLLENLGPKQETEDKALRHNSQQITSFHLLESTLVCREAAEPQFLFHTRGCEVKGSR